MKLNGKIFLSTLLPFLVIISLFHFLSVRGFSYHLVSLFQDQAENWLTQLDAEIRAFFLAQEKQLQLYTFINPPDQTHPNKTRIALETLLHNEDAFFQVAAINPHGIEWLHLEKFPTGEEESAPANVFSSPIYQFPMLTLSPYLGNVTWNKKYPLPLIDLSVPVRDKMTGSVAGLLSAQLSFQEIQTILERYLPAHGKVLLARADTGEILAQADDTRKDYSTLEKEALTDVQQQHEENGLFVKKNSSLDASFAFRKMSLKNISFLLLYYQPNEAIYFLTDRLKQYNILLFLSGVALFILSSFGLIRRITFPLHSITEQIAALGRKYHPESLSGQQGPRLLDGDEVDRLRQVLAVFEERLSLYRKEIEAFNRTLTDQVEEKTEELVELNRELEETNETLLEDIAKREQVEKELSRHQRELEQMVTERTLALSGANASLQEEVRERRKTELALAAEKEQLSVTLRSLGEGVITTDTNGAIVLMNRMAEELTGWTQQAAMGKTLAEVFRLTDAKERKPYRNPVEAILSSGATIELGSATLLTSRTGVVRNIIVNGATIRDKESHMIGVVLVFRDVTDKVKMEEQLAKGRKLEALGVLAGGIAHDFNNMLSGILGNINLASMQAQPDTKLHALLSAAEKATLRARDLTLQLLTFSKGGEPIREISSLAEIIRDSAEFVLRGSSVRCNYSIPEDLWPAVIDRGQIGQVIQNIVLNARHAMPEGGIIDIVCENVTLGDGANGSLQAGDYLKLVIRDRGIGIPSHLLGRIFDPYFTTKHEGSGLGLAISHSIVNKHGGHIEVESTPHEGTTFTIFLQALRQAAFVDQPLPKTNLSGGKGKILVMDDEEMVRDTTREMLSYLGYEVLLAEEGAEALDLYQRHYETNSPIDTVFMDLTIPGGMGGKEAVQKLLAMNPEARVIVMSGYSNDPIMSHFKEYGFTAVLVKPFLVTDLQKALA